MKSKPVPIEREDARKPPRDGQTPQKTDGSDRAADERIRKAAKDGERAAKAIETRPEDSAGGTDAVRSSTNEYAAFAAQNHIPSTFHIPERCRMTTNQHNKYTMYRSTLELLESNAGKTQVLPVFGETLGKFESLVEQIGEKDKERMTKMPGKGNVRDESEDAFVLGTLIVSSALTAFANSTGNAQLKGIVRISETTLRYTRVNEQLNLAKMVLDLATANLAALAPYGVTQSVLDDLKSRIAAYDSAVKQFSSGMAERTGARTAVSDLFIQADQILKYELDPLMQYFRASVPELYNEYRAARVIKDMGVRHGKNAAAKPPLMGQPN